MNVLVVLAHPDPRSLNHALAATAADTARRLGHDVVLRDLCAERFDPVLPSAEIPKGAALPDWLRRPCAELRAADGIVVVHPNWWGQPPAILTAALVAEAFPGTGPA